MRFGVHWRIGNDAGKGNTSFMYQLGTILPDWFERHPIHTLDQSLDRLVSRLEQLRRMPSGLLKDWYLGTAAHYLVDYCCMAHDEEQYYHFYRHRVFEVLCQRYEKNSRAKRGADCFVPRDDRFLQQAMRMYPALFDRTVSGDEFRREMSELIIETVSALRRRINSLHAEQWWTDSRVMELDLRYACRLTRIMLAVTEAQN